MPLCIAAERCCAQPILRRIAIASECPQAATPRNSPAARRLVAKNRIASHRVAAFSFNHQ